MPRHAGSKGLLDSWGRPWINIEDIYGEHILIKNGMRFEKIIELSSEIVASFFKKILNEVTKAFPPSFRNFEVMYVHHIIILRAFTT
uniref:Uncharacterized protein n=1 Tax=Arundo donax TaxID=35708 RepID=A0A0A9GHQ5_ARUDO